MLYKALLLRAVCLAVAHTHFSVFTHSRTCSCMRTYTQANNFVWKKVSLKGPLSRCENMAKNLQFTTVRNWYRMSYFPLMS